MFSMFDDSGPRVDLRGASKKQDRRALLARAQREREERELQRKRAREALRLQTLTLQRLVRHRGPDGSGIHVVSTPDGSSCSSVAHERLAIVDPLSGNQPLFSHDSKRSLAVNGEIYNHKKLRAGLQERIPEAASWFRTESDCEARSRMPLFRSLRDNRA